MAFGAFVALLVATGAMRLAELAVSLARLRDRGAVAEPRLFPAMAVLHVALLIAPVVEVIGLDRQFVAAVGGPALVGLGLATALRVWTLRTLGRAWNVRVVPPGELEVVTTGPYRWIRHPNYLCVVVEIACLPLVHSAWGSAVLLSACNAAVLAARVRTEEAELARNPAWKAAFAGRARFVPGIF